VLGELSLVYDQPMQGPDGEMLAAFGEFVRAQRRLAQVSQRNLAKMSGVSDSYLSQIERGNYRPSPQVVKALAQAFGLEPKQLYTMLGFIDEDDGTAAPSVEQAIQLDARLDAAQKEALIRIYKSFVKEG
jgi:transcriptional regulator with XRE-family HTH domain